MEKNDKIKKYAQVLRTNATDEENALWYQYLRKHPVQFRRQCPIVKYIVDFYCAKALLVVELDGSQHYEPQGQSADAKRTHDLENLGLKVLRFSNTDVNRNLVGVCEAIDIAVRERYHADPTHLGRAVYSTATQNRGQTPHPPPAGAPSPQGEAFRRSHTSTINYNCDYLL